MQQGYVKDLTVTHDNHMVSFMNLNTPTHTSTHTIYNLHVWHRIIGMCGKVIAARQIIMSSMHWGRAGRWELQPGAQNNGKQLGEAHAQELA